MSSATDKEAARFLAAVKEYILEDRIKKHVEKNSFPDRDIDKPPTPSADSRKVVWP